MTLVSDAPIGGGHSSLECDRPADEWRSVRQQAIQAYNEHVADYLCGTPLLADHLADGLSTLGYSCAELERQHM